MQNLNCIIIDDNPLDAEYLKQQITKLQSIEVKVIYDNTISANEYIQKNKPPIIFLDIDMPCMNGIDFFKQLIYNPVCIFVTAFSEYAIESYEAEAFDFILKPVRMNRLEQVTNRIQEYLTIKTKSDLLDATIEQDTVLIKEGTTRHKINIKDILYIEAFRDYSKIVTVNKSIMLLSTLRNFIEQLPEKKFLRVHRSYAVAINKVSKIEHSDIFIGNIKLPIGRTFKSNLAFI
jgi:DNA-binding LytR/AlgR family response regulator